MRIINFLVLVVIILFSVVRNGIGSTGENNSEEDMSGAMFYLLVFVGLWVWAYSAFKKNKTPQNSIPDVETNLKPVERPRPQPEPIQPQPQQSASNSTGRRRNVVDDAHSVDSKAKTPDDKKSDSGRRLEL